MSVNSPMSQSAVQYAHDLAGPGPAPLNAGPPISAPCHHPTRTR